MTSFISEHFLLQSDAAQRLYHNYAKAMPIIDYHCHLPPCEVATDKTFDNLTEIWLAGDHYKWRAMRTFGIDEHYITGEASDKEKFYQWAETVPHTLRNPLYHWTHLELDLYFDIDELLTPQNAPEIYRNCSEQLQKGSFSSQSLLKKMDVEVVCTTDDPIDSLKYHEALQNGSAKPLVDMRPAFRPDRAYAFDNAADYNAYIDSLEEITGYSIRTFDDLMAAADDD